MLHITFVRLFAAFLALSPPSIAAPTAASKRSSYAFDHIVAFGDELSDNGNGSYAHGITGDPANVYGFGTWTNGPVAVQYLAGLLNMPLFDYAFGGCCGGGSFGATINNTYTESPADFNGQPVTSIHDQIFLNFTNPTPLTIKTSMGFIWTGQNDLSKHTDAFWEGDPQNAEFAHQISDRIRYNAEHLIDQGAPFVLVANIYPKHLAPVTRTYLCPNEGCVPTWGNIITSANTAIKNALTGSQYSSQFIYHDTFAFMVDVMNNKDSYGLTQSLKYYCDGSSTDPNQHWDQCIAGDYVWEGAESFYWMNYIQPTRHVHNLIAEDMKKAIDAHFAA
ncbi:hypothetical protein B0A48_10947 [Cryoendolithus antarcticus]|uniref:SGNH hydrolase-type esterase domain-containing protein n=1 Tax=Cryoendolithus antarcticus TaxID=1507870 RepID=A0A1V8SYT6_9PEZI|nr:hypothetical protein B0A48_10947 [Cryoendolithus antarcticus]